MPGAGPVEFVRLTGPPAAATGLAETSFLPDKRFQLLAYLAYDSGWVGRERAAFLFWPDSDTATSRQNLRGLLKRLGTLPFTPEVEATNHQLRWQVPTDLSVFSEALQRRDTAAMLTSYGGPLLQGMEGDGSGEFGEWLEIEREALHGRWRAAALARLGALGRGEEAEAGQLIRRLLAEDALDEEAVRIYLETMERVGDPIAAAQVYREFVTRLARETGLEPTAATVAAFDAARAADPARPYAGPERRATAERPVQLTTSLTTTPRPLPMPATSFVGREEEIAEVKAALQDPTCRLLTLTGSGGMGKTRLALAVAHTQADPATFVPLDVVTTHEGVLPAIASALGLGHLEEAQRWDAVTNALNSQRRLLILDNFEHVLESAPLVAEILGAAPSSQVLVTSRERLGLEAEWVFPVDGLDYPVGAMEPDTLGEFGAVRLFLDRAKRVRPGVELSADDMPATQRFFAVTRGMPLAIELAAVWLRAVPFQTLVSEIEAGLELLESAARDTPARHGSIRAVFEQSWSRLTEQERSVLAKLTVFAQPMSPEAAVYVASTNRVTLAALVDKSLLRLDSAGRYDLHPLLQQFARAKLAERAEEKLEAERKHAAFYLRFLRERTDSALGPTLAGVIVDVHAQIPELRAATSAAAERGDLETVVAIMRLLELEVGYFLARGHDELSLKMLALAADAAAAGEAGLAGDLRGRLGDAYGINRGQVDRALVEYRAAAALARASGNAGREAVFMSLIGVMESFRDVEAARRQVDAALDAARVGADELSTVTVLDHRAYVLAQAGDMKGAGEQYRELLDVLGHMDHGDLHPYEMARRRFYATVNLGAADHMLGNYDEAFAARVRALAIAKDMGNGIWEAHARLELGEMHSSRGEHDAARDHLSAARALYVENNVTAQLPKIDRLARECGYELTD